jgi:hypothetical protein
MRGTKPAQQRARNTNLTNPHLFHDVNLVAASQSIVSRSMSFDTSVNSHNNSHIVAYSGNSGTTPPALLHTQVNENSNTSSLSLDLTPPEIEEVRDAALERIMSTDDDDVTNLTCLNALYDGLQRPREPKLVNAVKIMTKKDVPPVLMLHPLIKIIKAQNTNQQKEG